MIGIIHPVDGKVYELVRDSPYKNVCEGCVFTSDTVATKLCVTQPRIRSGYLEESMCVAMASHFTKPKLD